ncbi:MAG: flagellar motor switch phosphatase FliY [bacterium]|jgi:flagellar motor switch protein FliN/FliY
MSERLLSQEEINTVIKNNLTQKKSFVLAKAERDILMEISNIAMGTAATTLSMLLNHKVRITTPEVFVTCKQNLAQDFPLPHVTVEVKYKEGLVGRNLLVLRQEDAEIIAQAMIGDTCQSKGLLDGVKLSALSEAMNQMMGSAATSMSTIFGRKISITTPAIEIVDFAEVDCQRVLAEAEADLIRINFNISIEGLLESKIMKLIPLSFAKELVAYLFALGFFPQAQREGENMDPVKTFPPEAGNPNEQPVIQPAQFAPLRPRGLEGEKSNIDLLFDIPLDVSVELGRTQRLIKEVLELGVGSLLELDKLAGEPVDIRVNGKLIAKGEVVVVGENFGVRVTEIISIKERVQSLH